MANFTKLFHNSEDEDTSIMVNQGKISYKNNSVHIDGGACVGMINTGDNVNLTTDGIDWNGLALDIPKLYEKASKIDDNELRKDLSNTADKLQDAAKNKDESAVWSALKSAGKGTLEFIKTLSLQVLPALIMKKLS